MKLSSTIVTALGAAALASTASAQVFSEILASTSGTDREFVEIEGAPGQSTDGLMICLVESEGFSATSAGRLLEAFDLSGLSFGAADKYFVMGSLEASSVFGAAIDLQLPDDNLFQNQSNTFYLLSVPDATQRLDIVSNQVGQSVLTAPGALTTTFSTDPGITILDLVTLFDGDPADMALDNAPLIGPFILPNGNDAYPAGVARNGSCPGDWCTDVFVEFGTGAASLPTIDPTPGADNPLTPCTDLPAFGVCGSGGNGLGTAYCMPNPNSTGVAANLTAAGSILVVDNDVTLNVANMPLNAFGYFLASVDQNFTPNPNMSSGNLCLGGSIGRYVGPGQIQSSGTTGEISLAINLVAIPSPTGPVTVMPGMTWTFQSWFRDSDNGMLTSNFSQGLEITFQ